MTYRLVSASTPNTAFSPAVVSKVLASLPLPNRATPSQQCHFSEALTGPRPLMSWRGVIGNDRSPRWTDGYARLAAEPQGCASSLISGAGRTWIFCGHDDQRFPTCGHERELSSPVAFTIDRGRPVYKDNRHGQIFFCRLKCTVPADNDDDFLIGSEVPCYATKANSVTAAPGNN